MTEAVKVRDWLSELRAAAEADNSDLFRSLVVTIANAQPNLKDQVCQLAGDYLEKGEPWAASFFGPTTQPIVEESPKPQPDVKIVSEVEEASVDKSLKRRGWGKEEAEAGTVEEEAQPEEETYVEDDVNASKRYSPEDLADRGCAELDRT